MANNITVAVFSPGDNIARSFPNLWQWSRGQILQVQGIELPASYIVHFSNSPFGYDPDADAQIGTAEGVAVPDSFLISGQPVYAWIWSTGDENAETAGQVIIEVNRRAQPPDYAPTPEEEAIIDAAIAALNEGVEKADSDALKAEGFALGTQDGEPVTSESPYYENNAEYMRDAAAGYALQADSFSGESAAWATGSYSGGGMPVPDDAPQHNNNAKYYSQQAAAAQQAIEALSVLAESLEEGSSATATKTVDPGTGAVTITFGIPIGDTGATGNGISSVTLNPDYTLTIRYTNGDSVTTTSIRGATGATPNLTIGTVTTGAPGSSAAATITGTAENPVLNLTIPQGNTGDPGEVPAAALASTQASTTASKAIVEGEYFWLSGSLYIATAAIASGGTITVGTNCKLAKLADDVSDLKSALTCAFDPSQLPNMADMAHADANKYIAASTGNIATRSGKYVTPYIPVNPGDVLVIGEAFNSTTYGTNLYDSSKTRQSTLPRTLANDVITIPTGIYYVRTTVEDVNVKIYVISPLQQDLIQLVEDAGKGVIANFYARRTLKEKGVNLVGFNHCAFPSMCYFAGKEVITYHVSKSHRTPLDPANWGGVQLDTLAPDGTWAHIKLFTKADFTGLDGEIRDTMIQPSRDGQYLFFATWTTYYDASNNPIHDNLLVCMDNTFTVLNYKVDKAVSYIYWGNPLITPEGHLFLSAYKGESAATYTIVTYRSEEVFNGDVSTLTLTERGFSGVSNATEVCFGYFKDKMVVVFRVDNTNSRINSTSNLEGIDGWGTPTLLPNQDHAPKLLPYAAGDYCPIMFARYASGTLRRPAFALLNKTLTGYEDVAYIDPSIGEYSGYLGFVPRGGSEYDVVYYEESNEARDSLTAQTALYWKRFNIRELLPKATYLLG